MLNTVAKDVEDVRSLVWFRNDLRFSDHTGLAKACQNSKRLFGIYCFDPKLFINNKLGFPKMNVYRAAFILESIKELKAELLKRNISLIVKIGEPNNSRIFIIDNGILFKKANQFDYDQWMSKEFPDSDNAKVFNILINSDTVNEEYTTFDTHNSNHNNNLYSIGDSDSSDDEDPYFRGNIEEYIKGH